LKNPSDRASNVFSERPKLDAWQSKPVLLAALREAALVRRAGSISRKVAEADCYHFATNYR
jgi:hypothetical protein